MWDIGQKFKLHRTTVAVDDKSKATFLVKGSVVEVAYAADADSTHVQVTCNGEIYQMFTVDLEAHGIRISGAKA